MKKLAKQRTAKHNRLIEKLSDKVNSIRKNQIRLGGKVDYETNLLIMEDTAVDDDVEEYEDPDDLPAYIQSKRGDDQSGLTQSEKEKNRLRQQQNQFLARYQQTLVNFTQTISILDKQNQTMSKVCDEIA